MNLRYFLPIYLVVYSLVFFWRSFVVWKKTGINPIVFKRTDSTHDYIGRVFKIMFGLTVILILVYSFWPPAYRFWVPITWLERYWLSNIGMALLILSLAWTVLAQAQMRESWRVGIDQQHRTPLVRSGVFRFSRNPIYLGMMTTLLGLFLVMPNAVTLLTLVLGVVLIGVQVRLEEEFLQRVHGDDYIQYKQAVRRWV